MQPHPPTIASVSSDVLRKTTRIFEDRREGNPIDTNSSDNNKLADVAVQDLRAQPGVHYNPTEIFTINSRNTTLMGSETKKTRFRKLGKMKRRDGNRMRVACSANPKPNEVSANFSTCVFLFPLSRVLSLIIVSHNLRDLISIGGIFPFIFFSLPSLHDPDHPVWNLGIVKKSENDLTALVYIISNGLSIMPKLVGILAEGANGSVVLKINHVGKIGKRIVETKQEICVDEGGKDGVRTFLSDAYEKMNNEVDHNLAEGIESCLTVVVDVAIQSPKFHVNKEQVMVDDDLVTTVINNLQEIDMHMMLKSIEDVQHV